MLSFIRWSLRPAVAVCLLAGVSVLTSATAQAASIRYTFSAQARGTYPAPPHAESFVLQTSNFLPLQVGGPLISIDRTDPDLISCVPCNQNVSNVLHFLRSSGSDMIQFVDQDGTTRLYSFDSDALSTLGSHHTQFGINVGIGDVTVEEVVPEPSTVVLISAGLGVAAVLRRRRG